MIIFRRVNLKKILKKRKSISGNDPRDVLNAKGTSCGVALIGAATQESMTVTAEHVRLAATEIF